MWVLLWIKASWNHSNIQLFGRVTALDCGLVGELEGLYGGDSMTEEVAFDPVAYIGARRVPIDECTDHGYLPYKTN